MLELKALLLTQGMHGMVSQVEGLAKALKINFKHQKIKLKPLWNLVPPKFTPISENLLTEKFVCDSKIIISCGRKSVISSIGSAFVRFRIGIGGKAHDGVDLADHVLSKISADDWSHLQSRKAFLCESLLNLLDNGVDVAMNLINQTKPAPQSL